MKKDYHDKEFKLGWLGFKDVGFVTIYATRQLSTKKALEFTERLLKMMHQELASDQQEAEDNTTEPL